MRIRRLVLPVTVALLVAAGCSDSDEGSVATATQPASTDPAESTGGQDPTASCTADYKVMQVAVETYVAIGGTAPITEQLLVDEQLLRTESDTFDLMADGSAMVVVATPGGACDGVDLSLADEGSAPTPPTQRDEACEVQRKVLEVALEAYLANGGTLPVTEADLITAGFLRVEFDDYDIDGELVVPVGDPCAGQ